MSTPFKFRYASEITGTFVAIAVVLLVAGILVAGRTQGWMEGTFTLRTTFETDEGSFGLQEGSEIRIRDTVAGRVSQIAPNDSGELVGVFRIKNRFRPLVKQNSMAIVKKKFGITGDSYLDIVSIGKSLPVDDGFRIKCTKDEELMQTAQKLLKEAQPMLDQLRQMLANLTDITSTIQQGKGVSGVLVKNEVMGEDLLWVMDKLKDLMTETHDTLKEGKKLIKGVQKHWLFRKYIDQSTSTALMSMEQAGNIDRKEYLGRMQKGLNGSYAANNSAEAARQAYNIAVCKVWDLDFSGAERYMNEAMAEFEAAGESPACVFFLRGLTEHRKRGGAAGIEDAVKAAELSARMDADDALLESLLLQADILLSGEKVEDAKGVYRKAERLARKTESWYLAAMAQRSRAGMLLSDKKYVEAAAVYDGNAAMFGKEGWFYSLSRALASAGNAYEMAGNSAKAADRYYRASRSLKVQGKSEESANLCGKALLAAKKAGNVMLEARILELGTNPASSQTGNKIQ